MSVDKRNISISFGQGIDTKADPNQVIPGKLIALYNATLSETLALNKRNGYQPQATFTTGVASSSLTNQKLATFNNQLLAFDGKSCQSISGGSPIFIDNFQGAQPSITTVQREVTALINCDSAYNTNFNNTAYTWSSSCIAPNFQQLSFLGSIGKLQINSANGTVLASTGINNFVKQRLFSFGNNFYWVGIAYATSALQYYQIPATGSSASFALATNVGTGAVGGDFQSNTLTTGFNRYQRYDGCIAANNLYVAWFQPATSAINVSLITVSGVTLTKSFQADASGALGIFGDSGNVWVVYHNGATSAGFAAFSTSALNIQSGPNAWFTSDVPAAGNGFQVNLPQTFTGTNNALQANVYTQFLNYYPPSQPSAATITWNSLQRSDFIAKQSLNGALNATSGSSSVVIRGMGLSSKAFNYLGDDYFLAAYGGTQTASSADRLEPTYFLVTPTKSTNNIVSKIAYQNGAGYDFQTGGLSFLGNSNYGSVGYGLPLPQVFSTPANPNQFNVPYLIKTAAITLSSTSLQQPFFISYNYGINAAALNFNAPTLNVAASYGSNLNISGGYLAAFDGKNITEQNFHLFPEDVQLVGSSTFGPAANTYAYCYLYEYQDAQGNIFRSYPSKSYSITTAGSSAIYQIVPTLRATNKKNVKIRAFRNAPSIDSLTFHDINPLSPAINSPSIDNVVIQDSLTDAALIGNPVLYTTGNVVPDTGAPAPLWMTTYKLRLMILDPEQNIWWYSKEVIPGTTVEMSALQTFSVNTKYGNSNAGLEMDDKFILFTRSTDGSLGAIYYMTGEGPSPNGQNNDFSLPNIITSTLTTNNPNSLVLTPDGIMFQSDKGIWVLGQNLSPDYIGAPVEGFNQSTVTSANVIPGTTQVRFTLNSGVCLVWDYFQRQWSVFSNINATHGLLFQSLFTYLSQNQSQAMVLQETIGQYLDLSAAILRSLTTSWLSFAGLQGYQRASRAYLLGNNQTPSLINVSLAYDFNPSPSQTAVVKPLSNPNGSWGKNPFWGSGTSFGGADPNSPYRINFTRQKCMSLQITLQESLDPNNIVYGPGAIWEAIGVVIGGKLSYPKLPAANSTK